MSSFSPIAVGNAFIGLSQGGPFHVDPMKLQKLVYIAHGWDLARTDAPLIDENVEAWPYGPVVPSLYAAFKAYRSGDIDRPAPLPRFARELDGDALQLVTAVWEQYKASTAIELSMMTHERGYAWDLARKAAEPWDTRPIIPPSFIRDEFRRRLRAEQ